MYSIPFLFTFFIMSKSKVIYPDFELFPPRESLRWQNDNLIHPHKMWKILK